MQALLDTFGIQPILLVAQIINFLIVFFLLKHFAWKPILKILQDRKETIAQAGKDAQKAQIALDKALEKEKEILIAAQTEAQNTINDAKKQAVETANTIETQTRVQVEKMIAESQKKIEKQSEDAEKAFASKVSILAKDMLTIALKGMIPDKEQAEVLKKATKNLS